MKALVTGARGTVGKALRQALELHGVDVAGWDRQAVPPSDRLAGERLLDTEHPDCVFHLAAPSSPTGLPDEGRAITCDWSEWLAEQCAERGVRMLFTSTAMVFTNDVTGPFTPESEPDATEGYGGEKRDAERRVLQANPSAVVARLGWQIGDGRGGNQMVEHLAASQEREGKVGASQRWLPACSFLQDTAEALVRLTTDGQASGLYLIDSNTQWNYCEIASALNSLHGDAWRIEPNDDFVYDQRMIDPRANMPSLLVRLPGLAEASTNAR